MVYGMPGAKPLFKGNLRLVFGQQSSKAAFFALKEMLTIFFQIYGIPGSIK